MPISRPKNTVIKRFRISSKKLSLIIRCFSVDCTASQTSKLVLVNRKTVNRYYSWIRQLIIFDALKERKNLQIENGVEIDESYFGPRRVRGKGGRGAGRKIIVLGLLKRKGKVYCSIIPNASKKEIMPIIRQTVKSGADIYTDGWKSYDALAVYGYNHKKVKHKPLITKKLFNICRLVARKHANFVTRERKHDFLLRGILYCECGQRCTAEWHKINSKKRDKIGYYHCVKRKPCDSRYAEVRDVEMQVAEFLKDIKFSKGFISKLTIKIMRHLKKLDKEREKVKRGILNKKEASLIKRSRLEDSFLEGNISSEAYNKMSKKLDKQISKLDSELAGLTNSHSVDFDLLKEVMKLTRDIPKTYTEVPHYLKKRYLSFFFKKIIIKDKKIPVGFCKSICKT